MKKRKILIPQPKSRFLRVKCDKCGNEQTVFDHATFQVRCISCQEILVESTGGKTKIRGTVVKVLG
jgi:small subunit ribosomal protein S27e